MNITRTTTYVKFNREILSAYFLVVFLVVFFLVAVFFLGAAFFLVAVFFLGAAFFLGAYNQYDE